MALSDSAGGPVFLYLIWCGLTAASQTLSGDVLLRGTTPAALLTVQAVSSLIAWTLLVAYRRAFALLNSSGTDSNGKLPVDGVGFEGAGAIVPAIPSPRHAAVALDGKNSNVLTAILKHPSREGAGMLFLALLNAMGMLSAYKATASVGPVLSQVLKTSEVAISWAISACAGLTVGTNRLQAASAALLVLAGSVICALQQSGGGAWDRPASVAGFSWAAASAACLGLRSVCVKLLGAREVQPDSHLMLLVVLLAAAVAAADSCVVSGLLEEGAAGARCVAQFFQAASSPAAWFGGAAWFGYQWASFAMMARVSAVQHSVLNNAKRAVVMVVLLLVFPPANGGSLLASPAFMSGVALSLAGATLVSLRLQHSAYLPVAGGVSLLLIGAALSVFPFHSSQMLTLKPASAA